MYSSIEAHKDTVVQDDKLGKAVGDYARLLHDVSLIDVSQNSDFQARYRRFWALNAARLPPARIREHFMLLESEKREQPRNIEAVVRDLGALAEAGGGRQMLQFSFASKLLHMHRPELPIYDSLIAAFYFYAPPGGASERRLSSLVGFYTFLQGEYKRVIAKGLLTKATRCFRDTYGQAEAFTDQKVVDFLIWTYVRLLRSEAQRAGRLLFT